MWGENTKADPLRVLTDDGEDVAEANRLTAHQKVNFLELMLRQIANYCPIIVRNKLVKNSTSIQSIWNTISISNSRLQEPISSTSLTFIWNPMKDLKICTSG